MLGIMIEIPHAVPAAILVLLIQAKSNMPAPPSAPPSSEPAVALQWVPVPGGAFRMGPKRDKLVYVNDFQMTRTPITVEQYALCVRAGKCSEPETGRLYCNWRQAGREKHPVNCVSRKQSQEYADFAGGRFPTEEEYEYAARSGGKEQAYPWGDEPASCGRAVMWEDEWGCGRRTTWPVCSKPLGNSAHGICDLAGNVSKWMAGTGRAVIRGGAFYQLPRDLRADERQLESPPKGRNYVGIQLVR